MSYVAGHVYRAGDPAGSDRALRGGRRYLHLHLLHAHQPSTIGTSTITSPINTASDVRRDKTGSAERASCSARLRCPRTHKDTAVVLSTIERSLEEVVW